MSRLTRRRKITLSALTLVVVSAAAYAYWTQGGSGSGAAGTGSTQAVTVKQTSTISGLYPGGPAQALSGNFDNPNSNPIRVASVNATISSVTGPNIDATQPCTASDYQLSGFPVAVDAEIPSGTGVGSWSGGSVQLLNTGSDQDGCKGATVNISYTSN